MQVSVLLITKNEAANLPRCLDALAWCDDILLLDSGSTDGTLAIAEARGIRVLHRSFDTFAGQRNWGLEHGGFRHEWVLHLDADEVVTGAFRDALEQLDPPPGIIAYRVPSKLILFDTWLRHSGMYPVYQVRLGHREGLRFHQVGHGQRETTEPERVGTFPEPYLHYSFSTGLAQWLRRHVTYAADEAALLGHVAALDWSKIVGRDATERRRQLKAASGRIPLLLRPVARFLHVYLVRQGFRDGAAGLTYALMISTYEAMTVVLAREAGAQGGKSANHAGEIQA